MIDNHKAYKKLLDRFRHIAMLESIEEVLTWDSRTYLPGEASEYRADQIALLSGITHRSARAQCLPPLPADMPVLLSIYSPLPHIASDAGLASGPFKGSGYRVKVRRTTTEGSASRPTRQVWTPYPT